MRSRRSACTTAALAVAFTALGAAPAWAEPVVEDRPPLSEQVSGSPSGADPEQEAAPSPEVADPEDLRRDAYVAPFREARSIEYFVVAPTTIPRDAAGEVRRIDGVEHVLTVDAARVEIEGEPTSVLGVNPSSFRNYAPEPSAEADDIWQGVAEGRIALSNDVGTERGLEVGGEVTVAGGRGEVPLEVWTHATSGIAGIDALVSRETAAGLGMPEGNALVVSAPGTDLWELYETLTETLGEDVSVQLVADSPEPMTEGEAVPPSVVEEVIANAESQLGVPYVWGGTTPGVGFDCSGLLQWAFAEAGVSIPRVTHDQWNAGDRIAYEDIERGDLLFWRSDPTAPDYISHVAIYLGDGMMLEAPRTGLDVRVTQVRTANYAGAVRVHV
ncbi:C40 family peptidase [Nocardiopsis algeriensis]|uniref:C40 family peptidase n=1 Tax=Nocardiopsis algeriensis TaxID=1478215 RepID=UPI003B432E98